MNLPENVVKRGDVFQFRIDIPPDCAGRAPFGTGKEWKRSLKTRDPRQTRERAARMRIEFEQLCRVARAESDPKVAAAKRRAQWLLYELNPSRLLPDSATRESFAVNTATTLGEMR